MGKRLILFLALNFVIVATVGVLMQLLGVEPYLSEAGLNYVSLMVMCLLYGMIGAFISLWMSRWAAKRFMGVQVLDPTSVDPNERKLLDSVHSLAREAGLSKMPEVGVYDSPEVNAFATGPTRSRSLVAVSTGLLRQMRWEEAEGVLGHEIAHIANGDMVTMALLAGVVNAFVMFLARVVAFAIDQALRSRGGGRSGGLGFFGHFIVVMVLQSIFMIFGSMIIAAFSRWREYRADAGGSRLAGKEKMIGALKALQRSVEFDDPVVARVHKGVAAMKISSGGSRFRAFFSTHPPLEKRIARLEASSAR